MPIRAECKKIYVTIKMEEKSLIHQTKQQINHSVRIPAINIYVSQFVFAMDLKVCI